MHNSTSYFIIGGSGFLGNAFSNYLKQHNIVSRNVLRGEISDSKSLHFNEETVEKLHISNTKNIIIDFAYTSVPGTSFSDPIKDFTENLYNINSHLAFAAHIPNATYIYISSGGTVYGNVDELLPIKENANNVPLSPYGITKLASEKYALMYKSIYGVDVKIVRAANIYGPGQKPFRGQGFVATAIAKMILKQQIQIFGDGSVVRDYLFVDDFCQALYNVLEKGENGGIYNVGSEVGYSTNDVLRMIKSIVGGDKEPDIEHLPQRPFDVTYNVLDCTKLKKLNNNFYKVSLEKGIAASYNWLNEYLKFQ